MFILQAAGAGLQVALLRQAERPPRRGLVTVAGRRPVPGRLQQVPADRLQPVVPGDPLVGFEPGQQVKTGPYQLQAASAAIHDEAPNAEATDWPQIMALYELLLRISDNPVVALNHAVAVAMVQGPRAGLDLLAGLESDERIAGDHRLQAVRGHLLEAAGDRAGARDCYQAAARRALSLPQQRYLQARAARLAGE